MSRKLGFLVFSFIIALWQWAQNDQTHIMLEFINITLDLYFEAHVIYNLKRVFRTQIHIIAYIVHGYFE